MDRIRNYANAKYNRTGNDQYMRRQQEKKPNTTESERVIQSWEKYLRLICGAGDVLRESETGRS